VSEWAKHIYLDGTEERMRVATCGTGSSLQLSELMQD